jgi:RNA polymerase sigma-70 factor (ECF subfamily)
VDYYRRQPKQPSLPLEETKIFSKDDPVELLERGLTTRELRQALSKLTEDQKQVIILKFVDGLSNAEVAKVLGKTEGAVKSLQHRALASLARHLGELE